jgi:hypothetical protein
MRGHHKYLTTKGTTFFPERECVGKFPFQMGRKIFYSEKRVQQKSLKVVGNEK